jgi:dephospho-CoA kinase
MLHVGLTGNVASGKSTVAAGLAGYGAVVLDADRYAREAVAHGSPGLDAVVRRFGPAVLAPDGSLDRAALGRIVFADAAARRDLEAIVHPDVGRRRAAGLAAARAAGAKIVVSDIPLLYEAGLEGEFDVVVLVDAPAEARLQRLVDGRGLAEADARRVMAAQGDPAEKARRAGIVLRNDGSLAQLDERVAALWHDLEKRANGA